MSITRKEAERKILEYALMMQAEIFEVCKYEYPAHIIIRNDEFITFQVPKYGIPSSSKMRIAAYVNLIRKTVNEYNQHKSAFYLMIWADDIRFSNKYYDGRTEFSLQYPEYRPEKKDECLHFVSFV